MKYYKNLKAYSNEELIDALNMNEQVEFGILGAICSEILRRINVQSPIFGEIQVKKCQEKD